jgi:hypothetical protein
LPHKEIDSRERRHAISIRGKNTKDRNRDEERNRFRKAYELQRSYAARLSVYPA